MFIPLSVMNPHVYGGTMCAPRTVAVPATKSEIHQISVSSTDETRLL